MIITTHFESSSGNEHDFVFDVDVNWIWEDRNPNYRVSKEIDNIVFNWCFLLMNKRKREININKITCVTRKIIEDKKIKIIDERGLI